MSWTVTNEGFGPTNTSSWTDSVYLSTSTTLQTSGSGAATLLESFSHHGSLSATGSYSQTESVLLPATSSGTYYVVVETDPDGSVFEGPSPASNTGYDPLPIQVTFVAPPPPPPPSDLEVTSISPPSDASSGQSVNLAWTVLNSGPGDTRSTSWTDEIILSTVDNLNTAADETVLGDVNHSGDIASGSSYDASASVTLPQGISGAYFLFVVADVSDSVSESTYANNQLSVPLSITLTPPPRT